MLEQEVIVTREIFMPLGKKRLDSKVTTACSPIGNMERGMKNTEKKG